MADLPALGHFLVNGFGPASAPKFTDRVLRWKYIEPYGVAFGPRSYLARSGNDIVGHIGIVPREFIVRRSGNSPATVSALHFIDLLASPAHPGAGLLLMKRGFRETSVQFAIGGSAAGQEMATLTGYMRRAEFPHLISILRPLYRIHSELGAAARLARVGLDLTRTLSQARHVSSRHLGLRRVDQFGPEVDALLERAPTPLVFTRRSASMLNHYMGFPGGTISGWTFRDGGRLAGFALLNITVHGKVREGKVVDCFLESIDEPMWGSAIASLRDMLKTQGADVARCYGSTPWAARACLQAGFRPQKLPQRLFVRDCRSLLPVDVPYHLTPIEADHGLF